jgi:hypothetical protein
MNKSQLYRDAKAALAEASRLEEGMKASGQQLNAARWRLAQDMTQLSELGDTQRVIAEELGVSKDTVSLYTRVWAEYGSVYARRQSLDFGECLKEIRGGWGHEPITPEKRAERAAGYLRDREVWKDPNVQDVMRAQVRKDIREESRPSPPKDMGGTKLTVVSGTYWQLMLAKMADCTRAIREGMREMDRSGIPNQQAGMLIRQARDLAAAAQEFEGLVTDTAIGRSAS